MEQEYKLVNREDTSESSPPVLRQAMGKHSVGKAQSEVKLTPSAQLPNPFSHQEA